MCHHQASGPVNPSQIACPRMAFLSISLTQVVEAMLDLFSSVTVFRVAVTKWVIFASNLHVVDDLYHDWRVPIHGLDNRG